MIRMKRIVIVWLCICMLCLPGVGELGADDSEKRPLGILSDIGDDLWETAKSPGDWKWGTVAGVIGGTALLYTADKKITSWIKQRRTPFTCKMAKYAEYFGNPKKVAIAMAAFGLISLASGSRYDKDTFSIMFRSAVTTQLYVGVLKRVVGRERPNANADHDKCEPACQCPHDGLHGNPNNFHWFETKNNFRSFPSGHSAMAFSLAAVLSARTKAKGWDYIYYGIATLTALSRVHDEHHWSSDVYMGAVLGYFISRGVIQRFEKEKQRQAMEAFLNGPPTPAGFFMQPYSAKTATPIRLFPIANIDTLGMSLSFQF
jgi:PAP2 superfamily